MPKHKLNKPANVAHLGNTGVVLMQNVNEVKTERYSYKTDPFIYRWSVILLGSIALLVTCSVIMLSVFGHSIPEELRIIGLMSISPFSVLIGKKTFEQHSHR